MFARMYAYRCGVCTMKSILILGSAVMNRPESSDSHFVRATELQILWRESKQFTIRFGQ